MQKMHLKIVTPERVVFEDEVDALSAMTEMGELTILPGHISLVAALRAGEMRVKKGGEEYLLVASTGFLEVRGGKDIIILADTAERVEELQIEAIAKAREQAKAILAEKRNADDVGFADAAAGLERELARERVALKKGRKHAQ